MGGKGVAVYLARGLLCFFLLAWAGVLYADAVLDEARGLLSNCLYPSKPSVRVTRSSIICSASPRSMPGS